MKQDLEQQIEDLNQTAVDEKNDIRDNLRFDFADDEVKQETYGEIETWNRYVDSFNVKSQTMTQKLATVNKLLEAPYFARVQLQMDEDDEPEDYYIGSAAISENGYDQIIIDWRSPIAETYYNQENGKTSYEANGRRIDCDLLLRRQFDLQRDTLNGYFDTQVAIEDPMLLQSLSRQRSDKMQAITATIQKEQNAVIRHADVPAFLVNGIAGSGKTSVLLQRIAFLFYRQRKTLRPDQVTLMTLNPVFRQYIDHVLPDLGESNPNTETWQEFMSIVRVPIVDGAHSITEADTLRRMEEELPQLKLTKKELRAVYQKNLKVLSEDDILAVLAQHPDIPMGSRKVLVACDEMEERAKAFLRNKERNKNKEDASGEAASADGGEENKLQNDNGGAFRFIHEFGWLNLNKIGEKLLGRPQMTAIEYLYLRMLLTGECDRNTKYVMVDEVQDYSEAQILVLQRYFPKARFMFLGDEFQAIRPGTTSFAQIKSIFEQAGRAVGEASLMTSYRSSPEITELFTALLPQEQKVQCTSVQRPGMEPRIHVTKTQEEYAQTLKAAIASFADAPGLTAIVCENKRSLKKVKTVLGDEAPQVIDPAKGLPSHGTFLIELTLAKGLEFDNVILPDADPDRYPDETLSRHRMYTAISRAMQQLVIVAEGRLTPLVRG